MDKERIKGAAQKINLTGAAHIRDEVILEDPIGSIGTFDVYFDYACDAGSAGNVTAGGACSCGGDGPGPDAECDRCCPRGSGGGCMRDPWRVRRRWHPQRNRQHLLPRHRHGGSG